MGRGPKRGFHVAFVQVPKDANGITGTVQDAGMAGLEGPCEAQTFFVFNGIMTDRVFVFVDDAVARDLAQFDFVHEMDLHRAGHGAVAVGSKC